jgi:hypothetical protein
LQPGRPRPARDLKLTEHPTGGGGDQDGTIRTKAPPQSLAAGDLPVFRAAQLQVTVGFHLLADPVPAAAFGSEKIVVQGDDATGWDFNAGLSLVQVEALAPHRQVGPGALKRFAAAGGVFAKIEADVPGFQVGLIDAVGVGHGCEQAQLLLQGVAFKG